MKLYKKNLNNGKKILESIIGVEEDSVISDNNTIHVPTLGGCRMYNYENVEQAEKDVKRHGSWCQDVHQGQAGHSAFQNKGSCTSPANIPTN